MERGAHLQDFLDGAGWGAVRPSLLAGDASNRRYLRLERDGVRTVLMDAPPDRGEDVRPFVAMTTWLRRNGFSAPEVLAADLVRGFLILEDLGDDLYARWLEQRSGDEHRLYAAAVTLLADLSERAPPDRIDLSDGDWVLPAYDQGVLDREAALLAEWWMPAVSDTDPEEARAELLALLHPVLREVETRRDCVVLRDYHAENLLWLPDRSGHAQVGLLDYQDALAGHAAYDLVSLLEDARRDTSTELREAMIALFLHRRPDLDPDRFRAAYAALGAQRNLKIIGIFARLAIRDGKPRYLDLIPRVWGHLMNDLAHPDLKALGDWVACRVPAPDPGTLDRAHAKVWS